MFSNSSISDSVEDVSTLINTDSAPQLHLCWTNQFKLRHEPQGVSAVRNKNYTAVVLLSNSGKNANGTFKLAQSSTCSA